MINIFTCQSMAEVKLPIIMDHSIRMNHAAQNIGDDLMTRESLVERPVLQLLGVKHVGEDLVVASRGPGGVGCLSFPALWENHQSPAWTHQEKQNLQDEI